MNFNFTTNTIIYVVLTLLSLIAIYGLCQLNPITKKYSKFILIGLAAVAAIVGIDLLKKKQKPAPIPTPQPVPPAPTPTPAPQPSVITPVPNPVVAVTLDYQLSPNFTFGMMTKTEHRDLIEMNRQEALKCLDNLARLCNNILEPVRTMMGNMSITSGFRYKTLNSIIGGTATSQHCDGEAADTEYSGMTLKQAFNKIAFSNIQYSQVIFEFEQWVHIGLIDEKLHPNKKLQKFIASRQKQPDGTTKTVYTVVDKPL